MGLRAERGRLPLPLAVDSVLFVGLLLVTLSPSTAPPVQDLRASTSPLSIGNDSGVDLTVDPSSFWMRTGSNLSLESAWSAPSPLCRLTPLWYSWTVDDGNASGFLNRTSGASTTFTAESLTTGIANVTVRAGAVIRCGTNQTLVERTGVAKVSIVVPFSLSTVEVDPDPLLPGTNGTLRGLVVGGEPPYTLDIAWGNGTHSVVPLSGPGPFSVEHRFPSGDFIPSVLASDSASEFANVSVEEGVSVGAGLEVGIVPSTYVAEVGEPVEFLGVVNDPSPGMTALYDCSNATVDSVPESGASNETAFSCTFSTPGTAVVLFGVYPSGPGGQSASVVLYEPVVVPPRVSAESVEPFAEVGSSALVRVTVSGGVPPISLAWNLSGNRSGGAETLWSDGEGVIALVPTSPGDFAVATQARDALGSVAANGSANVLVDPPLTANATGASVLLSSGAAAEIDGDVVSGCPTFSWWVVPAFSSSNGSVGKGNLSGIGSFAWNASYAREGILSVTVGAVDECSAAWETVLEVPLVPPLSATGAVGPGPTGPNETLAVTLSIQGGLPPFRLEVNASDNESWNASVTVDGTSRWLFPTQLNGTLSITILVADSLGVTAGFNQSVVLVRPPPPAVPPDNPPPPSSTVPPTAENPTAESTDGLAWLLLPGLIPVGAVAALIFVRRRRARRERSSHSGPDPVATLKGIIQPADGAERFTVELLAEEAGIPLAVVRSTIDRLVADGMVRSESGADGEEVLSWSPEPGR